MRTMYDDNDGNESAGQKCPHCSGTLVRKSHRAGLLERTLLRVFFLRPYRCRECYRRFYASTPAPVGHAARNSAG